jgi:hypothetical protein
MKVLLLGLTQIERSGGLESNWGDLRVGSRPPAARRLFHVKHLTPSVLADWDNRWKKQSQSDPRRRNRPSASELLDAVRTGEPFHRAQTEESRRVFALSPVAAYGLA